jgi:hypothetical protein
MVIRFEQLVSIIDVTRGVIGQCFVYAMGFHSFCCGSDLKSSLCRHDQCS